MPGFYGFFRLRKGKSFTYVHCFPSAELAQDARTEQLSARMFKLRNACVSKAHELGMGIVAMKVVGGGILGAWPGYVVPGFDKKRLEQLPAAAIRYVLQDKRIHLVTIGMRLKEEVDANIKTLSADATYTLDNRALLAEYCAKALDSDAMKAMRID